MKSGDGRRLDLHLQQSRLVGVTATNAASTSLSETTDDTTGNMLSRSLFQKLWIVCRALVNRLHLNKQDDALRISPWNELKAVSGPELLPAVAGCTRLVRDFFKETVESLHARNSPLRPTGRQ